MRKLTAFMAGNLLALTGLPTVHAQETKGLELEEVVVTAEKRETDLQKTAISIQVYNGEDLKKQGKKRIDEIMNGVVGVQSQDSQVGNVFYMRGVSAGEGMGAAGTVAVLIDGVYQTRGETVRGGTLDLAQAEVLRGTQSTNLGGSALAGAVSLVSNQPVFQYQANGSLEVGNYNLFNTEGVLNMPLSDNQALRVAFSTNKRDGYLSSNAGNSDLLNGRLKYRWQASEDLNIVVTASHQNIGGNGVSQGVLTRTGVWEGYNRLRDANMSAGTCGGTAQPTCYLTVMGGPQPILGLAPTPGLTFRDRSNPWDDGYPKNTWPIEPYRDTNINSYSAEVTWNTALGELTLQPSIEKAVFRSVEPPRGTGTSSMAQNNPQDTEQFEARLSSRAESPIQWLAGAYYYHTDSTGTVENISFANDQMGPGYSCPLDPGQTTTNSRLDAMGAIIPNNGCYSWSDTKENSLRTQSLYGNFTWPVVDSFRVLGGLRYSKDTKANQASAANLAGTIAAPTGSFTYNNRVVADWSAMTYRTGVEYDLNPEAMVYATFATGYQPGSIDGMTGVASKKNTSDQLTVGVKSRFFDQKLQFNVEAFQLKFKDRPFGSALLNVSLDAMAALPTGAAAANAGLLLVNSALTILQPNTSTIVLPSQTSEGADFDISFVPTPNDRFDLAFEILKSTYGDGPAAPTYTVQNVLDAAVRVGGSVTSANPTADAQTLINNYNAIVNAYKGLTQQNSPKTSGNFTYEHRIELPGGATLSPRINAAYKGAYWSQAGAPSVAGFTILNALQAGSPLKQDAYTLWNAYLTWQSADSKYTLSGYVRNLRNEVVQINIGGEPGSAVSYVSLDAPRTFGVSINANF